MRGRKAQWRCIFWCHIRQGIQDRADTTLFFGGGAMSPTLRAHGTATTVSDAGSIEQTHRPIVFAASVLWRDAWPLADNAAGHQAAGASPVPPSFLFAQHVPAVEARSDELAKEGSGQSSAS